MTIKKGQDWGSTGRLDPSAPSADSDAALAALFSVDDSGTLRGPAQVGLLGGDLATTLGARATESELRESTRTLLPLDLAVVEWGAGAKVMSASLVIRSTTWTGPIRAVMNAAYFGEWNVAPSGHPNDGRLDVIEATLGLGDRFKARKRLPAGLHVPHPDISIRRLKTVDWQVKARERVWIDHVEISGVETLTVQVHPDATVVAI